MPVTQPGVGAASRREFLRGCACATAARALAQVPPPSKRSEGPRIRLAKTFDDAFLRAVSPDGKLVCLVFTRRPRMTFNLRGGSISYDSAPAQPDTLAVIALSSWSGIYSAQMTSADASFFGGSEALFVRTFPVPNESGQEVVIDLRTGLREVRATRLPRGEPDIWYQAFSGKSVVGYEYNAPPYQISALVRATLPDFVEALRVAYAVPAGSEPDGIVTGLLLSSDRRTSVYAFGHTIVCRRTDDLRVLWTRQLEAEYFGTKTLAISPEGERVAAAVVDTALFNEQKRYYIGVYGGGGDLTLRLPVNGDQALALSPHGLRMAVGKRVEMSGSVKLIVDVFDVTSGIQIAEVLHDRIPPGQFQILDSLSFRIEFSSDGKYLITSGNNRVKIWELN